MKPCPRPLDPIDAEAVAAGADPIFASDAASHARECAPCQSLIASARALSEALEGLPEGPEPGPAIQSLAGRVTRLRAFSWRERRTYALWNVPVLLTAGLSAAGFALLSLPALTAAEQVSVGAALLGPMFAVARSAGGWAVDLLRATPRGLLALSEGMRTDGSLGLAALLLLAPLGFGLQRVLARARR